MKSEMMDKPAAAFSLTAIRAWSPQTTQRVAIIGSALVAFLIYLTTLQIGVNGSLHPYATDVGEIQNALPRWGTLHFPGYPLYSLTGSLFVTLFRVVGVQPALGGAIYSALWGAVGVGLLVILCLHYKIRPGTAVLAALMYALTTSIWVDASVAEIVTMTMALTLGSLLAAIQFSRTGEQKTLFWLALLSSQAVLHQRALVFLAPGLALLVWRQRAVVWRSLPMIGAVFALGFLVYLYLPIRAWMGADWTFNAPGTWAGFWAIVLDTKTERIVDIPQDAFNLLGRWQGVVDILRHDWPWPLLVTGLLGLGLVGKRQNWLEAAALTLIWLPFLILSIFIWEGRVSDALLATNLPLYPMAALGLALLTTWVYERFRSAGLVGHFLWLILLGYLFIQHRPIVLEVTRDPGAIQVVAKAQQVEPPADGSPLTMMALWGRDYWALTYAQAYEDTLTGLTLVDHNADLGAILEQEGRLLTLSDTFYLRPLSWWQERYGQLYLSSVAPGVVELSTRPRTDPSPFSQTPTSLGNGITVLETQVTYPTTDTVQLTVYWQADEPTTTDYSVAVHLVTTFPPTGPQDILAQADKAHPVEGWYPTSLWQSGEIVRDSYLIAVPEGSTPYGLSLGMYYTATDGQFVNSERVLILLDLARD